MQARVHRRPLKAALQIAARLRTRRRWAYDRLRRSTDRRHGPTALPAHATHQSPPRARARLLRGLAAVAGVALLAGCGSSHSPGTSASPATITPAATPLYGEATVRPTGSLRSDALASGQALTQRSDPYASLIRVLETPGSPTLAFKHDVEPWLGPQAAIFVSSLSSAAVLEPMFAQGVLSSSVASLAFPFAGGAQGAIVMDTSDAAKASSFLSAQAARAGAHAHTYRGIAYQSTATGVSFGLVHRFAVIGSEAGMHGVIDTALGGPSLARAPAYAKLQATAPAGALAQLYSAGAGAGASLQTGAGGVIDLLSGGRAANVSLVPSPSSFTIDADSVSTGPGAAGSGLLSSSSQGANALGELPGGSWLAVGLADAGRNLGGAVTGVQELASLGSSGAEAPPTGISVKGLLQGLLTPLSVLGADNAQAKRDYASWMGSAGIFASGSSLFELKAAVVIESSDAAASRAAVGKLAAQLGQMGASTQPVSIPGTEASVGVRISGLPLSLDIAAGHSSSGQAKFVLGLGEASVSAALNPPSTMSSSTAYAAAESALGEGIKPSILVEFPVLLGVLEAVGLTEGPPLGKLVPYLRNTTTLVGGGHELPGEVQRLRLVLGLRQSG